MPEESEMSEASIPNNRNNSQQKNKKRERKRRTFEAISTEEIPYPKKSKMTSDLQLKTDDIEITHSTNSQLHTVIDNIWMISHALELPDVPMWVGFNSRINNNDSPQQIISYLTPINASPTSTSIVLETMEQSKKIAEDLHQPSIQVTYDLAIAKVAYQKQATETPHFDNLFIHLGPFHIMMAYFKAIGKVISACGLTNVMVESNLLANGSVNGFLDGKHFNRCKRLHPMVALGLEILHFKSFLQNNNITLTDDVIEGVKRLQNSEISSFHIENEELEELINNYLSMVNMKFICNVYNVGGIIDVDATRLQMFIDSYTVSDINEAFNRKKLRNFDASSLPSCKSELFQQFLRANYICCIWNNAHLKYPTIHKPQNNGWVQENEMKQYHFKWFEGDQLPNFVSDSLQIISETDEEGDLDINQENWSSSDEDDEDIDDNNENSEHY
ncbi:unnamed protein product [Parnassius apollo]|uniref:(apollo) hypothetical protein n=1 Tax=Parnassius apollo TaxID=110799 RepID=A0A8S3XYZ5_PARAO|nr:unnamed protein product [Parnassius apollo]